MRFYLSDLMYSGRREDRKTGSGRIILVVRSSSPSMLSSAWLSSTGCTDLANCDTAWLAASVAESRYR